MSVLQGRTIILSQHYFPSLRDGKYNLRPPESLGHTEKLFFQFIFFGCFLTCILLSPSGVCYSNDATPVCDGRKIAILGRLFPSRRKIAFCGHLFPSLTDRN